MKNEKRHTLSNNEKKDIALKLIHDNAMHPVFEKPLDGDHYIEVATYDLRDILILEKVVGIRFLIIPSKGIKRHEEISADYIALLIY